MITASENVSRVRRLLIPALAAAAVLVLGRVISDTIVADARRGLFLLAAGVAVVAIIAKTVNDWRKGLFLFFSWLLFEDLIRKYMGNNMLVYFGKDVLVAVVYLAVFLGKAREDRIEPFRVPFKYALGLFFLVALAQLFNPNMPSIFYGLLGLKLYFYYIPLMFVGYGFLRSEQDLRKFLVWNMVLAAIISSIGIAQSIIGLEFLNPHSGADIEELAHLVRHTPSGLAVTRPPSVFVSDGRFSEYLVIVFILGLGTAGYLFLRTRRDRKIVFAAVGLIAVAAVISGSRGAFSWVAISSVVLALGIIWGAPPKLAESYKMIKAIRRSFVFIVLALALAAVLYPEVVGARLVFYRETVALDSPDQETTGRAWSYPAQGFLVALSDPDWLIGHGTGTTSLGIQYVSRILDAPQTGIGVESGAGNLLLEFGILGPICWLLWSASLIFAAVKVTLKLKGTWGFPLALSITWFIALVLLPLSWGNVTEYQNFVANAYLWFCVGILFRLPAFALAEQEMSPAAWERVNGRDIACLSTAAVR